MDRAIFNTKNLWIFVRKIRRILRGERFFFDASQVFNKSRELFNFSLWSFRLFYATAFLQAIWTSQSRWESLYDASFSSPQWPVRLFSEFLTYSQIISTSFCLSLIGSFLCIFTPKPLIFRLSAFLGHFLIVALINSQGLFGNNLDMQLYPLAIFLFVPSRAFDSSKRSMAFLRLQYYWYALFSVGLAYFMAGIAKVNGIASCLLEYGLNGCEVGASILTNMAARESLEFHAPTFFGTILYDVPLVGGLSYLLVILFHLFSLQLVSRLDLHGFFLGMRIFFHFGTLFLFGIQFESTVLTVVGLFAASPYLWALSSPNSKTKWLIRLSPLRRGVG